MAFFLTFIPKMILLDMYSTLPPRKIDLNGSCWTQQAVCIFYNQISKTITLLNTQENSSALLKSINIIYRLLILGDTKFWQTIYTNPPKKYINTLNKLVKQSKKHTPSKLIEYCYALRILFTATPEAMIVGKWNVYPLGSNNIPTETVYHRILIPTHPLITFQELFIPVILDILQGRLALATILFEGLHNKINTTKLSSYCPDIELNLQNDNNNTIEILSNFSKAVTQHIQDFAHNPIELSKKFDPTLEDII